MQRTWQIARRSLQLLSAERSLLAVSVLSTLVALIVATVVFFAGLALVGPPDGEQGVATWLVAAAAVLVATSIFSIGQGAVVAGAAQHMEGRNPTIRSTFEAVRERMGQLLAWALLVTAVGRVLHLLRHRSGATGAAASSGGGLAFRVVSFLALPVVVFEGTSALESLKRSWSLLKGTWGENLAFNFGLKLLGLVLFAPAAAVAAGAFLAGVEPLPTPVFLAVLLWGIAVVGVVSALSGVLKTVLYRWANDLPVDASFDELALERAFRRV